MTTCEQKRLVLVTEARKLINRSVYDRNASLADAPERVFCTTLTAYLYRFVDITLPLSQQNELGETVHLEDRVAGNLVFVFSESSGHVGIATERGTIIHADPTAGTVIESTLEEFRGDGARMKVQQLL